MKSQFLSVLVVGSLVFLSACSLDVNVLGGKASLPSIGDPSISGPVTKLPVGNHPLSLGAVRGKNLWVGMNFMTEVFGAGFVDNSKNVTLLGDSGIYTFDANGTTIAKTDIDMNTYPAFIGTRSPVTKSAAGDYYLVSRESVSWGNIGILKVTPAGVATHFNIVGAAGVQFNRGGHDIEVINRTNGTEELHVIPLLIDSGGLLLNNEVEVFDLNGNYLRSYGGTANKRFHQIAQHPGNKNIYAITPDSNDFKIYIFSESGGTVGEFDLTGSMGRLMGIQFDASGRMYVVDSGDDNIVDDPRRGVNVYDITSGTPVLIRTLRSSVGHYIRSLVQIAVSPDGNTIVGYNSITQQTAADERWERSGTTYEFATSMTSWGSEPTAIKAKDRLGMFAVDRDENIYVDDDGNKRIAVYTNAGVYSRTFSVDHPDINSWDTHFVAVTSDDKIVTGGFEQAFSPTFTSIAHVQIRSKAGVELSTMTYDFSSTGNYVSFIGIDAADHLWFKSNTDLYRVDLDGTLKKTLPFGSAGNLGIPSGGMAPQAIGDKIYMLNNGDYTLYAVDYDGNSVQVMGSTQYSPLNLFAVFPQGGIQPLANGKFACLALTTSMSFLYVVVDPKNNYTVESTLTTSDKNAFTMNVIWTSKGLMTKGTHDRLFWYDVN
ncbi:hypothetical protein [Bdellovibrio sp. HCB209]|uniref:hypothetical protein n=1 Tax=Bdellovibrio sp. HCB209 TaxID=3394354 RepID=UPI0039B6466A